MYAEASDTLQGTVARMNVEPPSGVNFNQLCLHFWYHMLGEHAGELYVYYLQQGGNRAKVWSTKGELYVKYTSLKY